MAWNVRLLKLLAMSLVCLLMPVPSIAQTIYTEHGLHWNLQEGQMVNCTLTWNSDFGGLTATDDTPILGNITQLDAISSTFSELPIGVMIFYWPNGLQIEYQSTSSWPHRIGSIVLPLGNWSLLVNLLNATYTIVEETNTTLTIYSVFIPSPELPATWKNQTISKSDGFFLNLSLGYEYPNGTVTQFATIVRNGSLFTPTTSNTENTLLLSDVLLVAAVAVVIITVIVIGIRFQKKGVVAT